MINVIIIDDQVLLRKSLSQIISIDEEINVIGQGKNGEEAVNLCHTLQPDIILMDIEMPKMNGLEALKTIKSHFKSVKVIMLTTFENTENIVQSFLAKADGYITKDIEPVELITTIKCVNYGLTVIHKSVKRIMVDKFTKMNNTHKNYNALLSDEEMDMIKLIVQGNTNKELAATFNYTEGTVKNKVSRIYDKLNLSDRLQLAVYAVENGIE